MYCFSILVVHFNAHDIKSTDLSLYVYEKFACRDIPFILTVYTVVMYDFLGVVLNIPIAANVLWLF